MAEALVAQTHAAPPTTVTRAKPLAVLATGAVFALLLQMKFPFITGPSYVSWWYQHTPAVSLVPLMLLAGAPIILGVWGYEKRWWRWRGGIMLIMIGVIALMLSASWIQPKVGTWERAVRIVRSPGATSYWADAKRLMDQGMSVRELMSRYPQLMPGMFVHSQVRPPGLLLVHTFFLHALGPSWKATYAVAVMMAACAACAVLATFAMVRTVSGKEEAGLMAAAFMALCPGFILFFPAMDALYPLVTCGVVLATFQMSRTQKLRYAVGLGVLLALVTMCTYALLELGIFVVGAAIVGLFWDKHVGWTYKAVVQHWAITLGTWAAIYVLLWGFTGFNPIATFRTALQMQQEILGWIRKRPYPDTVLFDQTDFAFGTGWVSFVILGFALWGLWKRKDTVLPWVILGLVQIEVIAVVSLLPGETARLWTFLVPLLVLPIGWELARWDSAGKLAALVSLWAVLIVMTGRIEFVAVEPLDKLPDWVVMGR